MRKAVQVVSVVALLVLVVLLFLILNWYVAPTKPSERKDLVLAMAQILAGTALLSGLYFTWRTLQVNRQGQITERFTRAIDQLGRLQDGLYQTSIRVGGIYALERIARESEEDHWPIMEVLTAYVREHSPRRSEPTGVHAPSADIQAIMTVLRRRSRFFGHGESERLNLSAAHLTQADLYGANLIGADLTWADLSAADLSAADLTWAELSRANLIRTDLSGADLSAAHLTQADLSGANLIGANLSGADLSGAELTQKQLEEAAGDEDTKLPIPNLKRPAHWRRKTDEQPEED